VRLFVRLFYFLFTREGHFNLRCKFFRRIANIKLNTSNQNSFVYKRPDNTSFVYLKDNAFSNTIYSCDAFELVELRWASRWLVGGGTFIDGGANIGLYTTYIAQRNNGVVIKSIECLPRTYRNLEKVLEALNLKSKVNLILGALSNADGLWVENSDPEGFEECNEIKIVNTCSKDSIPTMSLSRLCDGVSFPHLIKLDLEGHEYPALLGLEYYLNSGIKQYPAILIEICLGKQSHLMELETWFKKYQYKMFFGGGFGQGPRFGTPIQLSACKVPVFNAIAIPSDGDSLTRWTRTLNS
jgi:FkbM family methyltransferase